MALPVVQQDVERALRPWLGATLVYHSPLCAELAERLRQYAPYRQSLEELHGELESALVVGVGRLTGGSMTVLKDDYLSVRLSLQDVRDITDELMGVVFDKLTPFSANFIKINDYSLRVHSLSALRVLCGRYAGFYSDEALAFMKNMIRTIYPPEKYEAWLKG